MLRRLCGSLCVILAPLATGDAQASWPDSPTLRVPICTAPRGQYDLRAVSDGAGGAIVCWIDRRSGEESDVYAQRISGTGETLWTKDGVPVCTAPGYCSRMEMIADGAGGAIIAWTDTREATGDLYAQRIGPGGAPLWTIDGIPLCTAPAGQYDVQLAEDGSGGAVAAWIAGRSGTYFTYAQKIDANGVPAWMPDGVPVSPRSLEQIRPKVVSDGAGGAIVTWVEWVEDLVTDLYAQRISADGQLLWGSAAVVCNEASNTVEVSCVPDGAGGMYAFFDDDRNGLLDLYGQHLDANGARQWAPAGVRVVGARGHQQGPLPISDGAGGAILTWSRDDRNLVANSLYTQRIGSDGGPRWLPEDIPLSSEEEFYQPAIAGDGARGCVVAWTDGDIQAQRIDGTGRRLWGEDGTFVRAASGDQYQATVVADGADGAIVAWVDVPPDGDSNIHAQHVPFTHPIGVLVLLAKGVAVGNEARLEWEIRNSGVLAFEVERRTEGGDWRRIGSPVRDRRWWTYVDRDLAFGARYEYRLAAGENTWGEITLEIPAPTAPRFELIGAWPNPARGGLARIALTLVPDLPATLEAFDLSGRRVAERALDPAGAEPRLVDLDTNLWTPGLYLVRLTQVNRTSSSRIVVLP
jgi:hypothetical protein